MAPIPVTDAIFLLNEGRSQPMHVGGLQLLRFPEDAPRNWLYHEIAKFRDTTKRNAWGFGTGPDSCAFRMREKVS